MHRGALDVAERAEEIIVRLGGDGGGAARADPILQLRLVQQRPPAPGVIAPTPGVFASKIARRNQEVLVARQDELPVHATDPGLSPQPRQFQRHAAVGGPLGELIAKFQQMTALLAAGQGNRQDAVFSRGRRRPLAVQPHADLIGATPAGIDTSNSLRPLVN